MWEGPGTGSSLLVWDQPLAWAQGMMVPSHSPQNRLPQPGQSVPGVALGWGQLCAPAGDGWAAPGSAEAGPHACGPTGPHPALSSCQDVAQQDQFPVGAERGEDQAPVQGPKAVLSYVVAPCQAGKEVAEHQGCALPGDTQPRNLDPGQSRTRNGRFRREEAACSGFCQCPAFTTRCNPAMRR